MRFLVLGASGMAGHTISLYLKERGHEVTGFSRRPVAFLERQVNGDARDEALLARTVGGGGFDVVVNCVGVLNQHAERDPGAAPPFPRTARNKPIRRRTTWTRTSTAP